MEHEEAAGAAGHVASAEAGMPQLDPANYPNLIFWLVIAIVVLYFILSRIAIPRIGSVLAERHDAIANDLEQAQLFKRRAEEADAAYRKALAEARDEAHRIAGEAKAEIQAELKTLIAKADAEIAAKAAESEERIKEIQASAQESVEAVARDTAYEIAEALMPGVADKAAVDDAVSERLRG